MMLTKSSDRNRDRNRFLMRGYGTDHAKIINPTIHIYQRGVFP